MTRIILRTTVPSAVNYICCKSHHRVVRIYIAISCNSKRNASCNKHKTNAVWCHTKCIIAIIILGKDWQAPAVQVKLTMMHSMKILTCDRLGLSGTVLGLPWNDPCFWWCTWCTMYNKFTFFSAFMFHTRIRSWMSGSNWWNCLFTFTLNISWESYLCWPSLRITQRPGDIRQYIHQDF